MAFLPLCTIFKFYHINAEKSHHLLKELNKIVINNNKDKIINITSLEKLRLQLKENNTNLKCSKNSIMSLLEENNIKLLIKPKRQRRAKSNALKPNFQDLLKRNLQAILISKKLASMVLDLKT